MDDNKFWLCIWSLAATFLLSCLSLVAISCWHDNTLRAEIAAKSADPMLAVCAYEADASIANSRAPYCTIYLSKGK